MMACKSFRDLIALLLVLSWGAMVTALPAPATTTTPATTTLAPSSTDNGSTVPSSLQSSSPTTSAPSSSSPVKTIIIVVIFVVLPIIGLWFCCRGRGVFCCLGIPCLSRKEKKRSFYGATHPGQIPGGVFLVPVQHFTPPDPRTGYSVRVDTPANPNEFPPPMASAPMYEVPTPVRAASPPGREDGRHAGWKGLFKA